MIKTKKYLDIYLAEIKDHDTVGFANLIRSTEHRKITKNPEIGRITQQYANPLNQATKTKTFLLIYIIFVWYPSNIIDSCCWTGPIQQTLYFCS